MKVHKIISMYYLHIDRYYVYYIQTELHSLQYKSFVKTFRNFQIFVTINWIENTVFEMIRELSRKKIVS